MNLQAQALIQKIEQLNLPVEEKKEILDTLGSLKNSETNTTDVQAIFRDEVASELLNNTILDLKEKQEELARANEELEKQKMEIQLKNKELTQQKVLVEKQRLTLEKSLEELEDSYQQLEQFSYVASHDLKSPLRTISNFASLLRKRYKGVLDSEADEFLDFIVTGVGNMNQVICDLLDYSRLGIKENDFGQIDLNDIVDLVKFNLNDDINSNDVALQIDKLPVVQANKSSMIQLFQNLIGNAIKFRKEDIPTEITIRAKENIESWTFSIQDNGLGMDQKFHQKAFQPFQRLSSQNRPGTGMGLAICKKVTIIHGGDISFTSRINEGTRFTFTLQKQCNPIDQRKAGLFDSN